MRWLDKYVNKALELRDNGLSASKIANRLNFLYGTHFSRNSVIGQFNRMKDKVKTVKKPKLKKPPQMPEMEHFDNVPEDAKTFGYVNDNECRWPYGTKVTHYCGKTVQRGSYCREHADKAYN